MDISEIEFLGKIFSSKLDGNLSVAIAHRDESRVILACTLFMVDGMRELDTFEVHLTPSSFNEYLQEDKLFSRMEDMYLNLIQAGKDAKSNKNGDPCLN